MHRLGIFPLVFEVAIQDDLEHANEGPTKPHDPPVDAHNALLGVESRTVSSLTVQLNIEKAIVCLMEMQVTVVTRQEGIHHLDILV